MDSETSEQYEEGRRLSISEKGSKYEGRRGYWIGEEGIRSGRRVPVSKKEKEEEQNME